MASPDVGHDPTAVSWHLLTGEYPPHPGGVSDYTALVARALAQRGQRVHVWAPGDDSGARDEEGVTVHRHPRLFTPLGLPYLTRELERCPSPRRLLLQYVPHAFGLKAMNLPLCAWFASRRRDERWVFFHEIVYPWHLTASPRHQLLAGVTRVMARTIAGTATRILVSIPTWRDHLPSHARARAEWCPIPSNLPTQVPPLALQQTRAELGEGPWLGHFGTHGPHITEALEKALVPLLRADVRRKGLLLGRGSRRFTEALTKRHRDLSHRLHARDDLAPDAVASHLAAMDLLLQPYPDGISTRRTSAMAGLALGLPILTMTGHLTESLWAESGAVALVDQGAPEVLIETAERLLGHPGQRAELGARAARLYRERFSLERTVETLLTPAT
ncbi:glycosyltransferase family 4 protein [Myxococcus stipitatus]|uniref:glycosyltransferase family 4 protein n=1 Tax=Myxococcus stipitatus TaxID=83455 RepID=UPI001F3E3535|nr:glycosyltransferase family 4 protein [Myxococcus stipitatus]MCE9672345.1 glycosyltransferase family 4 protein [Myxococcus stipitatus]